MKIYISFFLQVNKVLGLHGKPPLSSFYKTKFFMLPWISILDYRYYFFGNNMYVWILFHRIQIHLCEYGSLHFLFQKHKLKVNLARWNWDSKHCEAVLQIRIRIVHHSDEKSDPDPYQSEKSDPDPHQSENPDQEDQDKCYADLQNWCRDCTYLWRYPQISNSTEGYSCQARQLRPVPARLIPTVPGT